MTAFVACIVIALPAWFYAVYCGFMILKHVNDGAFDVGGLFGTRHNKLN